MWNFLFFLYQDVLPLHEISTAYVHSLAGELKGIRCKTFDASFFFVFSLLHVVIVKE